MAAAKPGGPTCERRATLTLFSSPGRRHIVLLEMKTDDHDRTDHVIEAPIETCFRLPLSIDLELKAAKTHHIRAVSGVTVGIIGAGQTSGLEEQAVRAACPFG